MRHCSLAKNLILILTMLYLPSAFAAGKLETARKQVNTTERQSEARSGTDTSNSASTGQSSIGSALGLILTAPIWIVPYISWHTKIGYFNFPYEDNEPGYFASWLSKSSPFETDKEEIRTEKKPEKDPSDDQSDLPQKIWAAQMQVSFGKENPDLDWINAQLSAELRFHIGL